MTATDLVLDARGITKHYGVKIGCESISLSVRRGHVFGFLGPNGAGKSTFVKMMIGLIRPTAGEADLLGRPLSDFSVRRRIGFLPENFRYEDWLTPRELLSFHGRLLGMERSAIAEKTHSVLDLVGLPTEADSKIRAMSKGMQQRLGLAGALLGDPDLLFLDEPTSALDPIGRHDVREILLHLKERGVSVFLNSHLLSEVESVCDEVAVIDHGRVLETGSLVDLLAGPCEVEVVFAEPLAETAVALAAVAVDGIIRESTLTSALVGLSDEKRIPDLVAQLVSAGARVSGVNRRRRTLEALFLATVAEAGHEEVAHV